MMKLFVSVSTYVLLLSSCSLNPLGFFSGTLPTKEIQLKTKYDSRALIVEVADTKEKWERGLMGRKKLADGRGMWFVFNDEVPRSFWMKDTHIPLDIIFFDRQRRIVSIIENMQPCEKDPCSGYFSKVPAAFALEVPAGYVQKHKLGLNDRVEEK